MITRHFMRTRQLKPGMKLDQTILDRTGRNLVMRGSILDDYAFVLWTSVSILSFTYAIPMIIAISMFADKKYTLKVGIASALINIVYIIIQYVNVGITSSDMVDYEIQIAIISHFYISFVSFLYISSTIILISRPS
jgi:hypothetical protein